METAQQQTIHATIPNANRYSAEYYGHYREGSLKSARIILQIVKELMNDDIASVADIGCGSGAWLQAAEELGASQLYGCDGDHIPKELRPRNFEAIDFEKLEEDDVACKSEKFALAICLEVAEHVSEEKADRLIGLLTSKSDIVLFSAAVPGQGGEGHVNEQWQDYWVEKFNKLGYDAIDAIRPRVWKNTEVEPWYRQNTIIFARRCHQIYSRYPLLEIAEGRTQRDALTMIHPRLYAVYAKPKEDGMSPSKPSYNVFLGFPTGYGKCAASQKMAVAMLEGSKHNISMKDEMSSALTCNFNELWCFGLNGRSKPHNFQLFGMVHDDIEIITPRWLDVLIEEMGDADMVSVIIPIKDRWGNTSTALDTHPWRPRRLTMKEVHKLPETFDTEWMSNNPGAINGPIGPILANTGLWVCRIDKPWAEQVCFNIRNAIEKDANGKFGPKFASEDWEFSRFLNRRGIRFKVTRKIEVNHIGSARFSNGHAWGELEEDSHNIAVALTK